MDRNSINSISIEWLRYIMAASIIFMHAGMGASEMFSESYRSGNMSLIVIVFLLIVRVLSQFAVPTFFLLSGYFFFSGYENKQSSLKYYKNKVKSRIRTLILPYFIWNTLFLCLDIVFAIIISKTDISNYTEFICSKLQELGGGIYGTLIQTDSQLTCLV